MLESKSFLADPDAGDLFALRAAAFKPRAPGSTAAAPGLARPGSHRGGQRGRGLDFLELRPYQAGDDIRQIHWRRSATHGTACTKVFAAERERRLHLVVDLGPQMNFGTRGVFKAVAATRTAALLGWTAARQGDQLSARVWRDGHWQSLGLRPARAAMQTVIALLARRRDTPTSATAAFTNVLVELGRNARGDDDIVLISDFYSLAAESEAPLRQLARRTRNRWWLIHDPFESDPPAGRFVLTDGASELDLDFSTPARREAQRLKFRQHCDRMSRLAGETGAKLCLLSTADALRLGESGLT
jgi:uncharacterized protein (DUF58 family)